MRAIGWLLAAIAGSLLLAAIVAWPAWQLAQAIEAHWAFHRVVSRLWQLLLLAGLLLAVRRLGLRSRADWGYGLPRAAFLRQFATGLAIGLATLLPIAVAIVTLGIRVLRPEFRAALVVEGIAAGLAAGLVASLLEETFFRGLMHGAVARESGFAAALVSTTLLYAAIHFLGRAAIPADELGWGSGFTLLAGSLARFGSLGTVADSFIALLLVGALLALVRERTGAIAAGLGLHMGWVTVIKATAVTTRADPASDWAFLVGATDGFTGWLVAAWAALLLAAGWRRLRGAISPVRA